MKFLVDNVQYHPNQNTVGVLVRDEFGLGGGFFINLVEEDLPTAWTDADVVTAAQARLDNPTSATTSDRRMQLPEQFVGKGHTIVLRDPPAPPVLAEEAPPAEPPAPPAP